MPCAQIPITQKEIMQSVVRDQNYYVKCMTTFFIVMFS